MSKYTGVEHRSSRCLTFDISRKTRSSYEHCCLPANMKNLVQGRGHMSESHNEVYQVHVVLQQYLAIHNDIFKFSLRRVIPIPGIFQVIDYGLHCRDLDLLISSLGQISICPCSGAKFEIVFQQYVAALLQVMQSLRYLCGRLHDKGEVKSSGYRYNEYNSDLKVYEDFVAKFSALRSTLRSMSATP